MHKEYFATTESRESLIATMYAQARKHAAGAMLPLASDGAALDWVDLDECLPRRAEILDFYDVLKPR